MQGATGNTEGKIERKFNDFNSFWTSYGYNFDPDFRRALKAKPSYARKFKRRLYKLYDYLKTREGDQIKTADAERAALAA